MQRPTVRQGIRMSLVTAVLSQRWARNATWRSNSSVQRAVASLDQGTASTTRPHSSQFTQRVS
jgi:hypothetical protein